MGGRADSVAGGRFGGLLRPDAEVKSQDCTLEQGDGCWNGSCIVRKDRATVKVC